MSHTTVRTFLLVALFSLPLSMPLHADVFGLPSEWSSELGSSKETSNPSEFTSDRQDDGETGTKDETGQGIEEGVPNKLLSPSTENNGEQTPPAEGKADPQDPQGTNPDEHKPEHNTPPKPDNKDEHELKKFFDLQDVTYLFKNCSPLVQKLYESVWFQLQTVGALTVVPFMTYKTLVHLKKLFTDKERRGKHAVRSLLYATGGILTLKAFLQYAGELNAEQAVQG